MKNICVGLIFAYLSVSAWANDSDWKITKVMTKDKSVAGYIYHTEAVGTQTGSKTGKVVSSIRLVCAGEKYTAQQDNEPLLILYWDTMTGNMSQVVEITTLGWTKKISVQWAQDGPLLIRKMDESNDILKILKTDKTIGFLWTDANSIQHDVVFSLLDFKEHLNEFNAVCKTNL